jgi:hypothetical protein
VHHASFGGHALTWHGHRVAGVPLLAGTMHQADMTAEVPGTWLISDGSRELSGLGTQAAFVVTAALDPLPVPPSPQPARTYYVAADEVEWDYAAGSDKCMRPEARIGAAWEPEAPESAVDAAGTDLNAFPEGGRIFVRREGPFLGSVYKKALYREYTSADFDTLESRTPGGGLRGGAAGGSDAHLGALGPVLRAAVGERVTVVFRNNLVGYAMPANLVPKHAVHVVHLRTWDTGAGEWVDIADGDASDAAAHAYVVTPGETVEYTFFIPPTAGPGPSDPSTISWPYGSSVDPTGTLYAGLLGAFIVARDAAALAAPGVDREFVLSMMVADENQSPLLDANIAAFAPDPGAVDKEGGDFYGARAAWRPELQ